MKNRRRRLVWGGAALLGATLAAILVPRWIDRRATPERLRSKEASEAAERRTPREGRGLRWETDTILVIFNPVEGQVPNETPREEPNRFGPPAGEDGSVH